MSESRLDQSPRARTLKHSSINSSSSLQQYPVRRMRNTAVLVKWIEEHQSNPYPTKAEKQYLAYYSGMNMTQLSTWFANARRRIKKIGMKTWLEGRSTFTVDFFPATPAITPSRAALAADGYLNVNGGSYNSSANPYAAMQYSTLSNYPANQQSPALNIQGTPHRIQTNTYTEIPPIALPSTSASAVNYGLYTSTSRAAAYTNPLFGWTSPLLPNTTPSSTTLQSRPSSNTGPTLHSPLTAQAYSSDPNVLRTQAALDISEAGPYSLSQHSPDQMIECANTEPILQGSSPKSRYSELAD